MNTNSVFIKPGDLVLLVFYNEGMRKSFYLGTCAAVKGTGFFTKIFLIRQRDRSCFSLFLASPSLLGYRVLKKQKI
jgi:hypothetical protein